MCTAEGEMGEGGRTDLGPKLLKYKSKKGREFRDGDTRKS